LSINLLIECIGLSPAELKRYLLAEIDEFLAADQPADREEEWGDVLFSLLSMAWAHSGVHYSLDLNAIELKVKQRLRTYATLTRLPGKYLHDRIADLEFGVLHIAFGNFTGQWHQFDPLKNGTVAEIHLLTDAPYGRPDGNTNHCIVTFDDTDSIEYEIIYSSYDIEGGNCVLCRVPDFMYRRAKSDLIFKEFSEYLSLQVMAALDGLRFATRPFIHFHSWECGFLSESKDLIQYIEPFQKLFSPYLTATRLKPLVEQTTESDWTMTLSELELASTYELKLGQIVSQVIVECERDQTLYSNLLESTQVITRSFAPVQRISYASCLSNRKNLVFIAGGRPVREKGFLELCQEFAAVRNWAETIGLKVTLSILCLERRLDKGSDYIATIENVLQKYALEDSVFIEPKVSLDQFRRKIANAAAVIVSSLFDPYCLIPTYAMEVKRPAFVSIYAGISENIRSSQFLFDPLRKGSLAHAIAQWYENPATFVFESDHPSYRDLYLFDNESR
jgi:hypothetical protein